MLDARIMPDVTVTIEGMHCSGCENRVETKLSRIEGVRSVQADHDAGTAAVTLVAGQEDLEALREAVETLGFDCVDVSAA